MTYYEGSIEARRPRMFTAYPFRPSVHPLLHIVGVNPTPYLQALRPGSKSFARGYIVVGPEHDHVATFEVMLAIQFREVCGGMFRREVRLETGMVCSQRATDYLLD